MATSSAMRKRANPKPGDGGDKGIGVFMFLVLPLTVIVGLAVFSPASLPLLCIGMLPSFVAVFVSYGTTRRVWMSVGGLNFSGLAYWLLELWDSPHTFREAGAQLATLTPILVGYGGAALGWMLYAAMPPVVDVFIVTRLQRRKAALAERQRKLVEQWDDGITRSMAAQTRRGG